MARRDIGAKKGLFSPAELIETSRREAGVADASILDTPGLEALCDGLAGAHDALHFIGRRRAQRMLVETLVKRLRIAHHLEREPSIRDLPIEKPIFLVAPFRTGTTLLHRLLAQDPAHRTPRLWETLQAPPLEPEYQGDPAYFERDYRVAVAQRYIDAREKFTPDLVTIHPTDVTLPEECFGLLETSMLSHSYVFYGPITRYLEWLDHRSNDEWRAAYALYADQLRLLQWWAPAERWLLKTPFHLWTVDVLCETFPDALVVQQHRSPAACTASFCSLMAAAYKPIATRVDTKEIGRIAIRYLRDALARNVAARERLGPERFIDIDYDALVADPLAAARRVYEAAGITLSPHAEARMDEWLGHQAGKRRGTRHHYALEDYGLSEEEVQEAFAAYGSFNRRPAGT